MDAFFAAIEVLDNPGLRGKPVIVGAPPDRRGVVSTASYEARAFGVRSAMPSRTAAKLCPQGVFVPVRMKRYQEVSEQVMDILEGFTPLVEQVSVDEAFLDVGGALRLWKDPVQIARLMKRRIRNDVGLTASVGVAPNKFLAKLGSDMQKPDGLTVLPEEPRAIAAFLAPLPVSRMWGVGRVTEERLRMAGMATFGDLQRARPETLRALVGDAFAGHVLPLAFGRDDRPVVTEYEAKSISSETTFDEDCSDPVVVRQSLIEMTEHVGARLRRADRRAAVGQIKVRFADFKTVSRQAPLVPPTHADRSLLRCALALLERLDIKTPVRLVGFGATGLGDISERPEKLLFETASDVAARRDERLDAAVDSVRRRYGRKALQRGSAGKRVGEG
jgi:DNA polymerase IV